MWWFSFCLCSPQLKTDATDSSHLISSFQSRVSQVTTCDWLSSPPSGETCVTSTDTWKAHAEHVQRLQTRRPVWLHEKRAITNEIELMHHFASSPAVFCLNHGSYRWETQRVLDKQQRLENCKIYRWKTSESHRVTSGSSTLLRTYENVHRGDSLHCKATKKKQPKAANNLGFYFLSVKLRVFSVSASRSAVHMETHVRVWRLLSVFNSKLTIRTILHPWRVSDVVAHLLSGFERTNGIQ